MCDSIDRQRVLRKIERVFMSFQQTLKLGIRPTLYLREPFGVNGELLELNRRNKHRFLFVTQLLLNIYIMVKTNTYRTKRDLFYEWKRLFTKQSSLDDTVNLTTRLLQECRFNLHILATSKGLVAGNLSFAVKTSKSGGAGLLHFDCRGCPVSIPTLPTEMTDIQSNAAFILIVEKDATFQCLVYENACSKLGPCIILTWHSSKDQCPSAFVSVSFIIWMEPYLLFISLPFVFMLLGFQQAKGYPDYATRTFLHRLHYELQVPTYALMDADPCGVDIYMMFKYGSMTTPLYDVYDISLPSLTWLGIYPTEASKLPLGESSKLPISPWERNKARHLLLRTSAMNEATATAELQHVIAVGYKIEIEAVSAIGHGYLVDQYLKAKLTQLTAEE